MLTIEKWVGPSPEQWEIMIEGMRNPKNSWDRMDSFSTHIEDPESLQCANFEFFMGENDHSLAMSLAYGGPVHGKFKRMIPVFVTINAPLYWWKEFDTYKVGTVANSCSTMHKIHAKEFTLDDFSVEHLLPHPSKDVFNEVIKALNVARDCYLEMQEPINKKDWWWQMIQLLPTSYNQKRTVMLNYEVLTNIYESRKGHKLDEWETLREWIEELPYSELIVGEK